jgi:hypothetical protein
LGSSNSSPRTGLLPESIIETSERRWFYLMAAMLGIMVAVIVVTGMTNMLHPPNDVERIDPTTLHLKGEFVESNLGAATEPDGSVTVRILAQQIHVRAAVCDGAGRYADPLSADECRRDSWFLRRGNKYQRDDSSGLYQRHKNRISTHRKLHDAVR